MSTGVPQKCRKIRFQSSWSGSEDFSHFTYIHTFFFFYFFFFLLLLLLLFIPLSLRTEHRASTVPRHPRLLFQFLRSIRHLIGLPGGGISPEQGTYLHRTTQHRKTQTHIHAPRRIRNCDPTVRAAEDSTWLRPLGYWDRQSININKSQFTTGTSFVGWRLGFKLHRILAIKCGHASHPSGCREENSSRMSTGNNMRLLATTQLVLKYATRLKFLSDVRTCNYCVCII
jgi:hypothetical protein